MEPAVIIDSVEFARAGEELRGVVGVLQLARLVDSLFDAGGSLIYQVFGGRDSRHRLRLRVSVEGEINLKCQRCLGSLPYPVAVESSLLVLTAGMSAASDEIVDIGDLDGVPADAHTDVLALVEDEVLLAIPFAARHPDGQCGAVIKAADEGAASPFSVLVRLKHDRNQN